MPSDDSANHSSEEPSPLEVTTLDQVISAVLRDLCLAQASADQTAVTLGQDYIDQQQLQHLQVPRARLGKVKLSIPLALIASSEQNGTIESGDLPAREKAGGQSNASQLVAVSANALAGVRSSSVSMLEIDVNIETLTWKVNEQGERWLTPS